MQDQAALTDIVEKEVILRAHMRTEADKAATDLIDSFLDPEHVQNFRLALSQALREAREQGQVGGSNPPRAARFHCFLLQLSNH